MKARSIALLLADVGAAAVARGQIITTPGITARLDLTWQEDPAYPHNDNGVLEPGEHALILMTLSFTGQNTLVSFAPPVGTFSSGTIQGFFSAYLDIRSESIDPTGLYNGGITVPASSSVGPNASNSGTSGYGIRGGWRLGGSVANGQPIAIGFANMNPGLLPFEPPPAFPNPITNLERLGWQPSSYAQRTQTFTVAGAAGTNNNVVGLLLDLDGGTIGAAAYLPTFAITFGSVDIPIVPGPAGLAALGYGGLIAGRRRRPHAQGDRPVLKSSLAGLLIAAAGLVSAARAQIITTPGITANLDLTWQEDPAFAHNDNGVLEPGERALILMTLSFSGQNTLVHIAPVFHDTGIILGFAGCYVDIVSLAGDAGGLYNGGITAPISTSAGPNADNAGTSGYGVRGGWRLGGNIANGQPAAGGMVNIGPGQLPTDPSVCDTTNPIANIERLGWQPASYAPRTQTFTVAGAVGTNNNVVGLYLDLDGSIGHPGTWGAAAYIPTFAVTFGSVDIPVVPGSAGLALLGIGALAAGCRRRRSGPLAGASR